MSDQRVLGLAGLFRGRLPINRKERYYTGTVLPMIVASDGFEHFGRFLALCGVPEVALEADPAFANVQFFTEYGFEESLKDGAEKRFRDPGGRHTPDLVVYIEGDIPLLLGVEAKVFHRLSITDLEKQVRTQAELLSVMADGVETRPSVHQVALLPAGFGAPERIDDVPVLTWERVANTFRDIAPAYWIGVLDEALRRYSRLASQAGNTTGFETFGQNCDAKILGQEIWDCYESNDTTYTWMGRNRGLHGQELQKDVETEKWRTQRYEVRHNPLPGNRNWFPIDAFIKKIEFYRRIKETSR